MKINIMEKLLGFIGTMVLAILVSLLATVIVEDYIDWFLRPIFQVPELTFGQVFSLLAFVSLISAYISSKTTKSKEGEEIKEVITGILTKTLILLFAWGLGYIYWIIIY